MSEVPADGQMYAMVTTEGVAAPETALCGEHLTGPNITQVRETGRYVEDIGPDYSLHNVTGNEELQCTVCGKSTVTPPDDVIVLDPGGTGSRVTELWAWLTSHDDEDESVVAVRVGDAWMPLVAADRARLRLFDSYVDEIWKQLPQGKSLKLVHFKDVEVVEERG